MKLDVGILAESCAENLIENLVENCIENWTDSYEQKINCENLVCAAHDCFDSIKNWDDSVIPDCKF